MSFENPEIPEGINNNKENPIKEFAILVVGVLGSAAIIVFLLIQLIGWWAPLIPFEWEQKWTQDILMPKAEDSNKHQQIERYLNTLGEKLSRGMDLDEAIKIHIHYVDDNTVNGFATLGGNIYIHRGLMELLESENALAMLVAHEIAHVKNRDPLVSFSRQVGITAVMGLISGMSDLSQISGGVGTVTTLTSLGFSRHMEATADEDGLTAIFNHYGHINGATDLFSVLQKQQHIHIPRFLSTHPLSEDRIKEIEAIAKARQWPTTGEKTPMAVRP